MKELLSKQSGMYSSSFGAGREGAFYSSLSLLIILNIIIKPLWIFGIDRQVQNTVGTEVYGSYFSLLNFSIVFSFLLDWGLTNFFNRQLAANHENFIGKIRSLFFIKIIFIIFYSAIVFSVAFFSGINNWNILSGVVIIQALTSLFIFFRSIITAQQWFGTDAWLSVVDKILMLLLCGFFIYFPSVPGQITIDRFVFIQIICTSIALLMVLIILFRRKIIFSVKEKISINKSLIKQAMPFAIIVLLMSVHYRLDGFLLERINKNGAYETGVYAGAYRLLDAANMIGFLVASFLLPFIARQQGQQKDVSKVVLTSRHFLMIYSILVAATVLFFAKWIQLILYNNNDEAAIGVLQWCLPVLICYSLVQVYGTVMTAGGKIIQFCYISLVAVLLNIILNLFLIPNYGAKGCCIAALTSQAFCGMATMLYVKKRLQINIHFYSLLMYIFIGVIICGFYYFCKNLFAEWVIIISAGSITIIAAVILKLFDLKNLRNIIRRNNL